MAELVSQVPRCALRALVGGLLCFFAGVSLAQEAGVLTHLSGTIVATKADGNSRILSVRSSVLDGERLATQNNTYARIKFKDNSEIVLRPNSQLLVSNVSYQPETGADDNFAVNLLKGGMRMVTGLIGKRNIERIKVDTPTATVGIRGTHFGLLMCQADCGSIPTTSGVPLQNGLHVDVANGVIQVSNPAGQQVVSPGQFGFVPSIQASPTLVPAGQGARVTMPPSISQNNSIGQTMGVSGASDECVVR